MWLPAQKQAPAFPYLVCAAQATVTMRKVIRYTAILVARSFWTLLSNSWNRRASPSDADSPVAAGGPAPGRQALGGRRSTWEPSPPPTKAQPQSRAVPEAPAEAPHLPNVAGPQKCQLWRQRGLRRASPGILAGWPQAVRPHEVTASPGKGSRSNCEAWREGRGVWTPGDGLRRKLGPRPGEGFTLCQQKLQMQPCPCLLLL